VPPCLAYLLIWALLTLFSAPQPRMAILLIYTFWVAGITDTSYHTWLMCYFL
jgi:hypothetical protein